MSQRPPQWSRVSATEIDDGDLDIGMADDAGVSQRRGCGHDHTNTVASDGYEEG